WIFGYFSMNAPLRRWVCLFCPPRTSWSHMVRVLSPRLERSVLISLDSAAVLSDSEGVPDPGAQAASRPAVAVMAATVARRRVLSISGLLPEWVGTRRWGRPDRRRRTGRWCLRHGAPGGRRRR